MGFFSRLFGLDKKSSATWAIDYGWKNNARWSAQNYEAQAVEGYSKCDIAYACINEIASAVASTPWELFQQTPSGPKEILFHPLLNLMKRPNPWMTFSRLSYTAMAYLLISGDSFIEKVPSDGGDIPVLELYPKRPDRIKVITGNRGIERYEWDGSRDSVGKIGYRKSFSWIVDSINQTSDILHIKTFNPMDEIRGLSPISAAGNGIDSYNSQSEWNKKLLDNDCRPAGVIRVTGTLNDKQFDELRKEIDEAYLGSKSAGRPMLLESGMEFEQMSLSPKDLDWINGRHTTARDICRALRVPSQILSIPGENTYSNMEIAWLAFWETTVDSYLRMYRDELNHWLVPLYGDNLYLDYDISSVPALAARKSTLWERAKTSTFLTENEKRRLVGYDDIDGGDVLLVGAGLIPLDMAGLGLDEPAEEQAEKAAFISEMAVRGKSAEEIKRLVAIAFPGGNKT